MAARVTAKFGDTGAGPGGFGRCRQVGSPSWFAKLGGLPFFRFATRELFYMLRVDLF
jgi:hypothetical protein